MDDIDIKTTHIDPFSLQDTGRGHSLWN